MIKKFENEIIREKTKNFCVRFGIKKRWFADELGVAKSTIYNYLTGGIDLSQRLLYLLNMLLNELEGGQYGAVG